MLFLDSQIAFAVEICLQMLLSGLLFILYIVYSKLPGSCPPPRPPNEKQRHGSRRMLGWGIEVGYVHLDLAGGLGYIRMQWRRECR